MLIKPTLESLMTKVDSKYTLVTPSTSPGRGSRVVIEMEYWILGNCSRRAEQIVPLPAPDGPDTTMSNPESFIALLLLFCFPVVSGIFPEGIAAGGNDAVRNRLGLQGRKMIQPLSMTRTDRVLRPKVASMRVFPSRASWTRRLMGADSGLMMATTLSPMTTMPKPIFNKLKFIIRYSAPVRVSFRFHS